VSMTIYRLLLIAAFFIISAIVSASLLHHTMKEALAALKMAFKYEFTSNVGRLNFISMILFVFVILVLNLEQMLANSFSTEGVSRTENSAIVTILLVGVLFLGSLICVMIIEKKK